MTGMLAIPEDHPRAASLKTREKLIEAMEKGVLAPAGLIAHGRGEAFDYLIGERTIPVVLEAIKGAAALLLMSERPVLSVNGNVAALVPVETVKLARIIGAKLEVNLFYRTRRRELAIRDVLLEAGAEEVLGIGPSASATIPELGSERRRVDPRGILAADTVFVPLEDGDRSEALRKLGKNVIAVDLNPLSRTSQSATITIVDNVCRALPLLTEYAREFRNRNRRELSIIAQRFDNKKHLKAVIENINLRLAACDGIE